MHCSVSIFKFLWMDRKWDTTVSLVTAVEKFLAGQRSSDNTCILLQAYSDCSIEHYFCPVNLTFFDT